MLNYNDVIVSPFSGDISLEDKKDDGDGFIDYCISCSFDMKPNRHIYIEFEYSGQDFATMKVWEGKGKDKKFSTFEFNVDIFVKHLSIYFQKHIVNFFDFNATKEIIDFYNDVITSPDTVNER